MNERSSNPEKTKTPDRVFRAMLREAARLGLPERFPTDMLHDQRALYAMLPETFGWMLYRNGTHTILPQARRPGKNRDIRDLALTLKECFPDDAHWYIGTLDDIREVSFEEFSETLAALDPFTLLERAS